MTTTNAFRTIKLKQKKCQVCARVGGESGKGRKRRRGGKRGQRGRDNGVM